MPDAAQHLMSVEEFFEWCKSREERYELFDGIPIVVRGMAGASLVHDRIVSNILATLHGQLRGSGCRPTTADAALRTAIKRVRRPDVMIECAPLLRDTYEAQRPLAVFEVLSPTTREIDRIEKLPEYMRHPTLQAIVHVDPDRMDVVVYRRRDDGAWDSDRFKAPTDVVGVADLPVSLSLAAIYEDVPFPA